LRHNKVYYVGLASNLRSRLRHHLDDKHAKYWDSFSVYLTVNDQHLRQLESLVIRIARPKGNDQKGKFGRAENLLRPFRRAIREFLNKELDDLFADTRYVRQKKKSNVGNKRGVKLAPFVKKRFKIRLTLHGKTFYARVRRDGMIRFRGKLYKSPSAAAVKITKHGVDGWIHWFYERAPGDWVPLDTLRR
jgi:hypothetical protein